MSPRLSPSELFLKAQTDERLLALAAEGHGRAFAVLIERHRRPLTAHARRLVGPGREEDVIQQALLRAWTSLERGAEVRHAQAWLHRIVHNTALTEIERQVPASEPLTEQLVDPRSAAAAAEQRLRVKEVLQGVSALPERQRLALLGTELEGRSRRQLAAELGLSEGAIRQLVHRARDGVRAAMAAFIPFPLLMRGMRASGWLGGAGGPAALPPAGETIAASGLATGAIVKAGAVVLAVGAMGGLVLHAEHGARHAHAHRHAVLPRVAVRSGARAAGPASSARTAIVDTAMRHAPVADRAVRTRHRAAPAAVRPASTVALAPAIPQPQTSIAPATGTRRPSGGSPAPAAGGPSGAGHDQSRSGSGKDSTQGSSDTTKKSSGDSQPATDPAVPASTGQSSSGSDQSSSQSTSPSSSSSTSSDSTQTSGSSSDSTAPSGSSSDSSSGQSTTTTSTAATTSTTPASGG